MTAVQPTDSAPATELPPTIGPYEILGDLGRGGSGRVFRARDTRLGREVALKVLHGGGDDEPRRQQRFLQEARAAGALNHPNIVQVYDVGEDGGLPYLATECIDGVSLRRELDAGPMPMGRVLDLATQIADGLAAAHQAGFVHRDLKPENVMVAKGRARIVDFGLAQRTGEGLGAPAQTLTAPHVLAGTAPYMSPEQARGATVDHRSDQFAFAATVHEMVTGVAAFTRATAIETLTAILHDEPPRLRDLNPRAPARLQQILDRCLAKSPDDRYASTADLHHDLRDLRDGRVTTDEAIPRRPSSRRSQVWRRGLLGLAGAAALTALGLLALDAVFPAGRDLGRYRIVPVATDAGYEGAPAWSPDGTALAYIAERDGVLQVMARDLASSRPVQLTRAVADCRNPMWAADGSRVYYISLAGTEDGLWSVGAAGGPPRLEIRGVASAALDPDGTAVVFLRDEGAFQMSLWQSAPVGAEPVRFADSWRGTVNAGMAELRFSPDGRRLGLWGDDSDPNGNVADRPSFWVIDYPSGSTTLALAAMPTPSRSHPFAWMADSRHIVFGADLLGRSPGTHLWMADTSSGSFEALTASSTSEYEPSVSPDGGRIAFVADASHYDVVEIAVDGGAIVPRTTNASDDSDPVWSPSGRQFAYVTTRSGRPEIVLSDLEGAVEVPLVSRRNFASDSFLISRPAISPDGQRIVFQRRDADGYFVWAQPMAGGQAVPTVPRSRVIKYSDAPTWSPDGEWLAFLYLSPARRGSWQLGKIRPGANEDPVELRSGVNFLTSPQWSPDGKWITVELQDGVYVVSPDGTEQRLVSAEPWLVHTWARDSQHVLAMRQSDENRLQLVSIDVATQQVRVLNGDLGPVPPTTPPLRGFSLSPDGTRLLTSIARLRGDIHVLDGFAPERNPLRRAAARWLGR